MLVVVTMFTTQMIIYVIVMKSCVEKRGRKIIQKIIWSVSISWNLRKIGADKRYSTIIVSGESRPARTESYNFDWEWIDQEMEGLKLDRGAGEIHYFDNVWVRQNYLSGKLDGIEVTFVKE